MDIKKLLTRQERTLLGKLSTPVKIQDYLDTLKINFEPMGDTARSPRFVMREGVAHCFEGALVAALALWYHNEPPLLLDLVSNEPDTDHVVALFKRHGHWGAISKTNHAVLRYREPVYENIHELVMSYFHEYFTDDGKKTLRNYAGPLDLAKIKDTSWITTDENLWHIVDWINDQTHYNILTPAMARGLRKADKTERKGGKIVEWKK
ncbi:MAG TPA: hypothetical protein VJG48_02765 [Candidatus Paceibacterota bacterium]